MSRVFFVAFAAPTSLVATKELIRTQLKNQLGFESKSRSSAHMTVKSSVLLTARQLCRLEDKLMSLVASKALQAFSAALGSMQTLELPETDEGILYLPVKGEHARSVIKYLLAEFAMPHEPFEGELPRIALANVPLVQLPLALGEIQALSFPKETRFSAISIYEKGESGAQEFIRIPLEPALVM